MLLIVQKRVIQAEKMMWSICIYNICLKSLFLLFKLKLHMPNLLPQCWLTCEAWRLLYTLQIIGY
jgi:hypothetical protein